MTRFEHEWAPGRPMTIEHCAQCGAPRNRAKPTECPVRLREVLDVTTAELGDVVERFQVFVTAVQTSLGAPAWEYPGQVIRDVQATVADSARVARTPGCQCHWEEGDSPCRVHGEEE